MRVEKPNKQLFATPKNEKLEQIGVYKDKTNQRSLNFNIVGRVATFLSS